MTNPQLLEEPQRNSFFGGVNVLEYYINSVARSLIALLISFTAIGLISMKYKMPFGVSVGIAIIIGLLISPMLMKIKVGHTIVVKYDAFLNKQAERFKR